MSELTTHNSQLTTYKAYVGAALAVLPLIAACAACGARQEGPRREVIAREGVSRLPVFSSAVRTGNLIFLSGAIGVRPGGFELVPGGIGPETRQTLENLRSVLHAAGADLTDVVKCTVFLADINDYQEMNRVYAEFFPKDPPARSTLGASGLAFGARVEIECIAAVPEG